MPIVKDISPGSGAVDVSGPSAGTQSAEMDPDLSDSGCLDSGEITGDIFKWVWSAHDFVSMVTIITVVAVSLFLHEHDLDWAVGIVAVIATVLISRRDPH
ncbi:hypothetical protein ACWDUN_27655 [Mycobacterium sp. NPDC003323]